MSETEAGIMPEPSSCALLEIKDLVKEFPQPGGGDLTVLDIERFSLDPGERAALIGESGGGKTTLLHVIAGLVSATSGSIRMSNLELTTLSEAGRDRFRASEIGYVFQTFNLLPAFTALENVQLGMTFSGRRVDMSDARDLLDRVGLAEREHYLPKQLSVGQQQRVAIARALAGKPRLLLADEPTANVDPASADSVIDLILNSCRETNVSLLMVTHSMEVAGRFERIDRLEEINRAFKTPVSEQH